MEMMQAIPTRAQIASAWLKHVHSFDRCGHAADPPYCSYSKSSPPKKVTEKKSDRETSQIIKRPGPTAATTYRALHWEVILEFPRKNSSNPSV